MATLPEVILELIFEYCTLCTRSTTAMTASRYMLNQKDWRRFSRQYRLVTDDRDGVKSLLSREYRAQISISRRLNVFWSNHFCAPLVVWSPWTVHKCCQKTSHRMVFNFRNLNFIDFVRRIAHSHKVKPSCLQRLNLYECASASIYLKNTKRMEMTIDKNSRKRKRFCLENTLNKAFYRARALLEFRIASGERLNLKVHKLEFLA
jgi:hypothetical protein